jgi:hypothetical protein
LETGCSIPFSLIVMFEFFSIALPINKFQRFNKF